MININVGVCKEGSEHPFLDNNPIVSTEEDYFLVNWKEFKTAMESYIDELPDDFNENDLIFTVTLVDND